MRSVSIFCRAAGLILPEKSLSIPCGGGKFFGCAKDDPAKAATATSVITNLLNTFIITVNLAVIQKQDAEDPAAQKPQPRLTKARQPV
jgi:hypothetical protein